MKMWLYVAIALGVVATTCYAMITLVQLAENVARAVFPPL